MWKRNGLSIVLLALMLAFVAGQAVAGLDVLNQERAEHGWALLSMWEYLRSGHFVSATFENWESEFLQMGMYVLLTVKLRQKGSAESRPIDLAEEQENIQPGPRPWPVRVGGWWLRVYNNSLSIAFGLLFAMSFCLHLAGSWRSEVDERAMRGEGPISIWQHLSSAEFWFESFQNWQSEFLAVLALVLLTIWLRQKDSPQSKAVQAPHSQTGD
ncbi:hypothetical protein JR065_07590 [Xanthomonas sp. AmX2]|uniref:DUF6766 family protein n=1 Tax=Xanthomonas sp. TaxID=29446 RepID=UPI00197FCA9F|nr:DUF6766 family protein [Xanthomonas sp.]MBN6150199.1 hypothetical protein [Xanthomonas sp.]